MTACILFLLLGQSTPGIAITFSDQKKEQVSVISASAPKYSYIAFLTRTKGYVLIDVTIDPAGKVITTKVIEGHPLLRKPAEDAAALWIFQSDLSSTKTRDARLTFVFDIVFDESVETRDEAVFVPPSRFEITRKIATIAPLHRVGGHLPEKRCHLHGEALKLDVVPILYGLPAAEIRYLNVDMVNFSRNVWKKLTHRETYSEAESKRFPNSNMHAYGGCIVDYERKAEVLYCRRCRDIKARWRRRHPNKGPEIVAVISGGKSR